MNITFYDIEITNNIAIVGIYDTSFKVLSFDKFKEYVLNNQDSYFIGFNASSKREKISNNKARPYDLPILINYYEGKGTPQELNNIHFNKDIKVDSDYMYSWRYNIKKYFNNAHFMDLIDIDLYNNSGSLKYLSALYLNVIFLHVK